MAQQAITEKQRDILTRCEKPKRFIIKREEDIARRLLLKGYLDRASSAVPWQRRYVLTEAGRELLGSGG